MRTPAVFASLAFLFLLSGTPSFAAPGPIGTYYITEGSPGGVTPQTIWAMNGNSVARTNLALNLGGFPIVNSGPIAVYGNTVATNGVYGWDDKPLEQYGEVLSGAPGLNLTDTGAYTYNHTTTENFIDGTSDGAYNYMIGENSSALGTIYRCNLDWSNPTPVAQMRQALDYAGITYDATNNSFWVVGNWSQFGYFILYDVTLPNTLGLANFNSIYICNQSPFVDALAMDVDHTLWVADVANPGKLLHYDTSGTYLGSFTPTNAPVHPLGGEIAAVPEPPNAMLALLPLTALCLSRTGKFKRNRRWRV